MRTRICILASLAASAAALLISSSAGAQEVAPGTTAASKTEEDKLLDPDEVPPQKKWSVGAGFETNRSIIQQDVGGRTKAFNTASINGGYAFTHQDRVAVIGGIIQRFIADPTETGVRADDIVLSYAHTFHLPAELNLTGSLSDSLPISYYSKLMGLIAIPRASLSLSRNFLDNTLGVSIRGGGAYYIVEYKEPVGQGVANPRASTDIGFSVSYAMPFHRQLQIAGSASTSWEWSYNTDHMNDPVLQQQFGNTPVSPSADQYFGKNPPAQQRYGGSVSILYDLPSIVGIGSTVQVGISQGDGVLRDGATHLYWLSRRGGQMSAALSANY